MIHAFAEDAVRAGDENQTAAAECWLAAAAAAAAEQMPLQQHSHELVYPSAGTVLWNVKKFR